jgi:hypothetical protein
VPLALDRAMSMSRNGFRWLPNQFTVEFAC